MSDDDVKRRERPQGTDPLECVLDDLPRLAVGEERGEEPVAQSADVGQPCGAHGRQEDCWTHAGQSPFAPEGHPGRAGDLYVVEGIERIRLDEGEPSIRM